MNERILELAKEADEYADATLNPGEFHPDWHDVRDARFAELIVREHLSLLTDCYRGTDNAREWDNALLFLEKHIKEHFGVEE